jgi:hypothetical protein
VSKLIFMPLRLGAGLLAGVVGKKLFQSVWGLIDDQEPPKAEQRLISVRMLALALVIEGALFRALRGLADHSARRAFAGFTGSWPGEREPEPEHRSQDN